MNNNDSDKKNALQQEDIEQLEWERLQNEAIAAQRWRLEQEMKQAGQQSVSTVSSGSFWTGWRSWSNGSVIAALAAFIIVSLLFAFCCVW